MAQSGRASGLGPEGRRFESYYSDQFCTAGEMVSQESPKYFAFSIPAYYLCIGEKMEKANCKNCGDLPIEMFYRHHKKGYQSLCKNCKSDYNKKHYIKDKSKYINRAEQRNKIVKDNIKEKILTYLKDKKCARCPESDVIVLDFHHREPKEKAFEIATGVKMMYKWEIIEQEISKCEMLCANCHRRLHAKENNSYKYQASLV